MTSSNEPPPEREPLLGSGSSIQSDSSRPPSRRCNGNEARTTSEAHDPRKRPESSSDGSPPSSRHSHILFRIAAAMLSFTVLGMMVSTLGVMVPQFEAHYGLTDFQVSFVFLVWPIGYVAAAWLNSFIHQKLGQRGIATIGPLFHIIMATVVALHPPFPVLLLALSVGSLGTGILDGSFCAWAGGMRNANVVQGFLHGSYSTGAGLGPFIAGSMLSVGDMPWYSWYYVLLGLSVLEAIALFLAFRFEDSKRYLDDHKQDPLLEDQEEHATKAKTSIFRHSVTWICAAYFLACIGTENAISGWIVVFMTRVNHASAYLASISSSGFWIGQAAGRLALGVVTDRVGVRTATIAYLVAAIGFEVLFAVIRIPVLSAVAIALLGFCLGPLFPCGVVMVTRLLPRKLHVEAISFVVLIGQVGGALLPFALGALAENLGIQVFQVVVFVQLVGTLLIWLAFPRLPPTHAPRENRTEEISTQ